MPLYRAIIPVMVAMSVNMYGQQAAKVTHKIVTVQRFTHKNIRVDARGQMKSDYTDGGVRRVENHYLTIDPDGKKVFISGLGIASRWHHHEVQRMPQKGTFHNVYVCSTLNGKEMCLIAMYTDGGFRGALLFVDLLYDDRKVQEKHYRYMYSLMP